MEMEQRIAKIEQTLLNHEQMINAQAATSKAILEKLNELVFLEKRSAETFDHHQLTCRNNFDKVYVSESDFKLKAADVFYAEKAKEGVLLETKSSIFKNFLDISWKVSILCAGIAVTILQFV